jgi:hypothetical protein
MYGGAAGSGTTAFESLMSSSGPGSVIVAEELKQGRVVGAQRREHFTNLGEQELQRMIEWIMGGARVLTAVGS